MATESPRGKGWERPGRSLLWTEPARSMAEFGAMSAMLPTLRRAPRGDGHHVLVLPGFMATDTSTKVLRWYLRDLGYEAHGWDLGLNVGPTDRVLDGMIDRIQSLAARGGQPISLIGWSLGGVFAREMAGMLPGSVRCVITMGSPFTMTDRRRSNVGAAYTFASTFHSKRVDQLRRTATRAGALTVPTTAIYTREDGIVPWRACMDEQRPQAENIRVSGSHVGLGHNHRVLMIIADRLAQPRGQWKPYAETQARRNTATSATSPK